MEGGRGERRVRVAVDVRRCIYGGKVSVTEHVGVRLGTYSSIVDEMRCSVIVIVIRVIGVLWGSELWSGDLDL